MSVKTAIVLGAGFSVNAGLPTQAEFSSQLLGTNFVSAIDQRITKAIREYLAQCFHWKEGDALPSLEDMFTMIDLSAGSGHNFGLTFTPKKLRALRRMLIFRTFQILDARFHVSSDIKKFLHKVGVCDSPSPVGFIVLNWDIVLERHLEELAPSRPVSYCVSSYIWRSSALFDDEASAIKIAKVHGSSNWVYCDNCRAVFFDRYKKLSLNIQAGLIRSDFRLFEADFRGAEFNRALGIAPGERDCPICSSAVGPHIATFSFKKSFRTHAFSNAWLAAEQMLSSAKDWIFVGYSLPEADYEFKHLLKSCQLKLDQRGHEKKKIEVIVKGAGPAADRYKALFGARSVTITAGGLSAYVR